MSYTAPSDGDYYYRSLARLLLLSTPLGSVQGVGYFDIMRVVVNIPSALAYDTPEIFSACGL
jgi:hypothetical protein